MWHNPYVTIRTRWSANIDLQQKPATLDDLSLAGCKGHVAADASLPVRLDSFDILHGTSVF